MSDELADAVISEVGKFRSESNDPITVLINSPGGDLRALEVIDGALRSGDQDGNFPRIITVVSGDAKSAAANLLAYGDYAIAYLHSEIHFHGVRASEIRVTAEDAAGVTRQLGQINRKIANNLSQQMIGRFVHRYTILRPEFGKHKRKTSDDHLVELECFINCLRRRVGSKTSRLLNKAWLYVQNARSLTKNIFGKINLSKIKNPLKQDAKVLRTLIDHEVKTKNPGIEWRLNESGVNQLIDDYFMLRDYNVGEYRETVWRVVSMFGVEFLKKDEFKQYDELRKAADLEQGQSKKAEILNKASHFLMDQTADRIAPLWFFVRTLCRELLKGENPLDWEDAYWIGVVDEVAGTELQGRRLIAEQESITAPDDSSGT